MIVRCLLTIPTYNNEGAIISVIREAIALCTLNIQIIDDGSDKPVLDLIKNEADLSPLIGTRINVFRFNKNVGKGAAIQQAFKLALAGSYTHIITMDGDAQHKAQDVPGMLDAILISPWALIIGKRKLDGVNVPESSKFGRSFSNFWVKYQTDYTIEDSQSGFRAYPLFYVQHLKFYTKKYDFEIEVLIRLLWSEVEVKEVEIDVYYPPAAERVSHFDKFRDNVKISLLNTVLVIISLLKSNISRGKIIASISIGAFIGVLPIYGFQVFLAALVSLLFRLNFPLMFIAGQISIPPLIPIWTYISLRIGSYLTGSTVVFVFDENILNHAKVFFSVLFVGSIGLGTILACFFGIMTYIITYEKKKKKKAWTGKNRGGHLGNWIMKKMTTNFGPKTAYLLLYFICPYFYLFAPKAVKSHNQYFKILYPKVGFVKRQFLIVQTFYKLGQVLIDNLYTQSEESKHFSLKRDGRDHIKEALEQKKGFILVGSHVGGWMFASKIFHADKTEGFELPTINVVEFDAGAGHSSKDKIESSKINFITNSDNAAIFKINQAITQNELVIFMGDRVVNQNIELVPFMGKLAALDSTAFKIAVTKKSPMAFTFGFKGTDQTYDLFITQPVLMDTSGDMDKSQSVLKLMMNYTETLEHFLNKYPTQWFNFYQFWSTLPDSSYLANSKKSTHN